MSISVGLIEPDLAARRAIPVPLGFVVGAGLVLVLSAVAEARRRRSRPTATG
ncbi:MAG TPA: hypothetical protein VID26_08235 [Candidatus Limnocylindrales bacterium]